MRDTLFKAIIAGLFLTGIAIIMAGCDTSHVLDNAGCDVQKERYPVDYEDRKTFVTKRTIDCRGPAGETGPQGEVGPTGEQGPAGRDGIDGRDGTPGVDGADGVSCSVAAVPGGAVLTCGDSSAFVSDGADGQDAQLEVIYPCLSETDTPTIHDEALLRLPDGTLFAFTPMHGGYLTQVPPGRYRTTDKNACRFNVLPNGKIVTLPN